MTESKNNVLEHNQATDKLLSIIQESISSHQQKLGFSYDSKFHIYKLNDGSILLEHISRDYRIGFSLDQNIEESSWYFVTNKDLGNITSGGYIQEKNLNILIPLLLNFIFLYETTTIHAMKEI